MTQTIKQRIFDDLRGSETDSNHVTRRMFRCWLEGSYLGAGALQISFFVVVHGRACR